MAQTRDRILLGGPPGEIPELAPRRSQDLDLIEGIDLLAGGGLRLDPLGQLDLVDVDPDVDPDVAEQKARQVLVRLFAVDDAEEARVGSIDERLPDWRRFLAFPVDATQPCVFDP